ncbi:hypothetical protein [Knoellia aerolata]|uniref:Uncharacterized protein n=1 Tax=Knoellia aerolata DSM 18566 TaxID=1385519 RepID=A0A0A0JZZ5_9MICO|nr:hypothetical protein [Knoellia aerolata]KGN41096.1 hypothetical protein N801_09510 [Knoellia aerolata DSM 18566]
MTVLDRLRIENAVLRYDFWLEMRGVRGSRRRELRRELRANLGAASADVGTTRALFGIGSPKGLAYAATDTNPSRPRWSQAAIWASVAFGLVAFACLFTAIAFTAGVEASGVTGRAVRGFVFPWFGVDFSARVEADGGGFSTGAGGVGTWFLGVPLLVFLLVAQPWRLLRRQQPAAAATSTARARDRA